MSDSYEFRDIEKKWQQYWRDNGSFQTEADPDKDKYYCLNMYPYPSGDLHMGHMRNYIIGDVLARYHSLLGECVMHPMGWDAFGLPAENAAIKRGIHPSEWTEQCVRKMKSQFNKLGISYDWRREINASEPDYYEWTQWLFLQLYHNGLAYTGEATVNWCPSCQTVLANEELEDDVCERCATPVEARQVDKQWFLKITDYAGDLLDDLELLKNWPQRVRTMQEHWIGRSHGVSFRLPIEGRDEQLEVFTTRIDTIYGITYMVLAPEHPMLRELVQGTEYEEPVMAFASEAMREGEVARSSEETEKRGMFTGAYAVHPLTQERLPIWVGNYVLMEYGTGAIMAVPAHDQRDLEFARQHDLPVRVVIQPEGEHLDPDTMTEAYVEPGVQVNSGQFDGIDSEQAKEAIADHLEEREIGYRDVNYRLRDWLISRQRYWGTPIPIIWCDQCGDVPVPQEDLPVVLPEDADFRPTGESPLERHPEFAKTTCPKCGKAARRETDTMTTFVDSSWYYLRYTSPHNSERIFDQDRADYWLPVDQYVGGVEHAVRHLLYSRFMTKALHDQGYVGFVEPFERLFNQGMIYKDGSKMSKSRGNVVGIDQMVQDYGADTARTFILFVGPPEQDAEWSDEGVQGAHRFLNRLWRTAIKGPQFDLDWAQHMPDQPDEADRAMRRKTHQTVQHVTEDIEQMGLNTVISSLMELTNELSQYGDGAAGDAAKRAVYSEGLRTLLILLAPVAPHLSEELWQRVGLQPSISDAPWPVADQSLAAEESLTIVVQVNGKLRDKMEVPAGTDVEDLKERATELDGVKRHVQGKDIAKIITVPDRLINIVAR